MKCRYESMAELPRQVLLEGLSKGAFYEKCQIHWGFQGQPEAREWGW